MKKVAICVTGGHFYNWAGKDQYYNWLHAFCEYYEGFVPYIVSWRPEDQVPDTVKKQFGENILYRENEGLDWGCYNHFYNYMKESKKWEEFDYFIFTHDDILSIDPNWPLVLIEHLNINKQFSWSCTHGQLFEINHDESIIKRNKYFSADGKFYGKCFIAHHFAVRADDVLYNNNPFSTIVGDNKFRKWRDTDPGDISAGLCVANILNVWGVEKIGWSCQDGWCLPNSKNAVLGFKRGATPRDSTQNMTVETALKHWSINEPLERGFIVEPGKIATHPLMNEKGEIFDP